MNSDFEELLSVFNRNDVKYLIVGGHAVMLYTEPRYTKDLDVWLKRAKRTPPEYSARWRSLGLPWPA
jgi:hypothetical protein